MFLRHLEDCAEFVAGDGSALRELLHPAQAALQIRYSLAHAKVAPGQATKRHRLRTSEVYYIMAGQGLMHINEESSQVCPGCTVYVPPGCEQYIENTGESELMFLCIVEPAWKKEDEQVFDSR
jgi:mannose-6-phosphate isomerase-like protein (cupin superfamily)